MTEYYHLTFSIQAKNGDSSTFLDEIVKKIRNWLEQKYGIFMVNRVIPNWVTFRSGGSFSDKEMTSRFRVVTNSGTLESPAQNSTWVCEITESRPSSFLVIPRQWVTEIELRIVSPSFGKICYTKKYHDLIERGEKLQPLPPVFPSRFVESLLRSKKWTYKILEEHPSVLLKKTDIDCMEATPTNVSPKDKNNNTTEEGKTMEKRWISLCMVRYPDKKKNIWLQRLADVENGMLVAPSFDESKEPILENRRLIYREDGPEASESIGFWDWSDTQSESGRWLTDSTFIDSAMPLEIVVDEASSRVKSLLDALKTGIDIPDYICSEFFFAVKRESYLEGILCNLSDFKIQKGQGRGIHVSLKNDVFSLPYYRIDVNDIFSCNYRAIENEEQVWRSRSFYKRVNYDVPTHRLPVHNINNEIKQLILQGLNWPVFRAEGVSKNDWRKLIDFLSAIPEQATLEKIAETFELSNQDAEMYFTQFLKNVEKYIDAEDVDADIIAQILENHKGLWKQFEEVAKKLWASKHLAEITEAQEKLSSLTKDALSAEEDRKRIVSEVTSAQAQLDQLRAEILKNETLGQETVTSIKKKITDAQNDLAGFIADLSVFFPEQRHTTDATKSRWNYRSAEAAILDEDIEIVDSWQSELDIIQQNLSASLHIDVDLSHMLAAFLYSAHINHLPILIAGPGGEEIADIMSISIYGKRASQLTLGEGDYNNITESIANNEDQVILIQNMFGPGWNDYLPQTIAKLTKQVIWTHPYLEDLVIEPKGLYNFMIPVFSECFVGGFSPTALIPGKRSKDFKPFVSQKERPIRTSSLKNLGLSKLCINQLGHVLSDAKAMIDIPAKEKEMDVLFGLLPFSVLTGKIESLADFSTSEDGISALVKAEISRFTDDN